MKEGDHKGTVEKKRMLTARNKELAKCWHVVICSLRKRLACMAIGLV